MGNIFSSNSQNKNNTISLKISITKDYKLQIKSIDSQNKENIVKLTNNQEIYTPCICFKGNFITICEENESAIHFMKEWFDDPKQFKFYSIKFQEKEYQLLPDVLFAIIINEFKHKIEKDFIIKETFLFIPSDNYQITERINI